MLVDLPAASVVTEIHHNVGGRLKGAGAIAQGSPDSAIAKTLDVPRANAFQIGEHSWVPIDARTFKEGKIKDAPAAKRSRNSELTRRWLRPCGLGPVRTCVLRNPDIGI